jgi:hypothetical protein
LEARGCGFVGTAVCVELVDVDEFEGVGEDEREGVGVTAELVLELDDRWAEVGGTRVRLVLLVLGLVGANGEVGDGSLMSDARCCSCRDASDVVRRSLLCIGSSVSYPRNCLAYAHSPRAGRMFKI